MDPSRHLPPLSTHRIPSISAYIIYINVCVCVYGFVCLKKESEKKKYEKHLT